MVKVLDFGLAKMDPPDSAEPAAVPVLATMDGIVLGTVSYMSPEQARGLPVDKRADIWAFGCVLYEMLDGERPFGGDSAADVLGAITEPRAGLDAAAVRHTTARPRRAAPLSHEGSVTSAPRRRGCPDCDRRGARVALAR